MKPPWDVGMKKCANDPGHMTKVASRPIYGKIFKYQLPRNQNADNTETWYTASDTQVPPSLLQDDTGLTLSIFMPCSNLFPNASAW